jgi:membrane associated rhomboid family serine protease
MNEAEPLGKESSVDYAPTRWRRAFSSVFVVMSGLLFLLCTSIGLSPLFLGLSKKPSTSISEAAETVLGSEILVLLGFGALLLLLMSIATLRWRLTLTSGGIEFRGPFKTRSLNRSGLEASWTRRWGIGPKVFRIRVDGDSGTIWVPSRLVDARLRDWFGLTDADLRSASTPAAANLATFGGVDADPSIAEKFDRPTVDAAAESEYLSDLMVRVQSAWLAPTLIVINVLACFVTYGAANGGPITTAVAIKVGANVGVYTLHGEWWRLWTCTFIHFGIVHITVNMIALFQGGRLLEAAYGPLRFGLIYFLAGGLGSLLSALVHPQIVSAGASGAIFGVYGVFLTFLLRPTGPLNRAFFSRIGMSASLFCAMNLLSGFSHSGIDNAAHIGGLAGGLIFGTIYYRPLETQDPTNEYWLKPILIAAASLYLLLSLPVLIANVVPKQGAVVQQPRPQPRPQPSVESSTIHQPATSATDVAQLKSAALRYRKGLDVKVNAQEAIKWYIKAADLGDAEAQYDLGDIFEHGEGVPTDMPTAIAWYTKGAEQGESLAQDRLARIYENGSGVPRDMREAIKWYRKAAEQGEILDQYRLGELYSEGRDVPKNIAEAKVWYQKAADQGFQAASNRLKLLASAHPIEADPNPPGSDPRLLGIDAQSH